MAREKRVVISGIGPLSPAGIGKDVFWEGILNKKIGLKFNEIKADGELWDSFYYHGIDAFDINSFNISGSVIDDILQWKRGIEDKDLYYLLAAVKLAIDDSNILYDQEDNNIGLFLTVEHPGFEPFCEGLIKETAAYLENNSGESINKNKLFRHIFEQYARSGYDQQSFMYLFFIAKAFGLHGYSLFTNNSCASGLYALESAARQIKYGGSDVVILAGGDIPNTMFKHKWFSEQGLYSEDGMMKPFSKNSGGIVLGEGASALVLEELDHALNRGAHIYAEYSGGGFSLESWKVTMPRLGSSSYRQVIEQALRKSGMNPEDIDLINPHGVAIKATDAYEARGITDVFGTRSGIPFISAFKPYVGHNLGGSAIIESIIILLSMENGIIPPTLNCDEVEPKHNIELVHEYTSYPLNAAMKLSCGFAGYNAAGIFKKLTDKA